MKGGEKEFDVIHIHIQLPTWYRQRLFFPVVRTMHTRDTLCHSMGEERRQILENMLSRILKMCR
jgi:hypothetical protein